MQILLAVGDKAKVEVAEIVIHSTATRQTAHHLNLVLAHKIGINFLHAVLIAPDDDRRRIDVKQQQRLHQPHIAQQVLFNG